MSQIPFDEEMFVLCEKHGYPLTPEKINRINNCYFASITIACLSFLLFVGLILIYTNANAAGILPYAIISLLISLGSSLTMTHLVQYTELQHYTELEKLIKTMEKSPCETCEEYGIIQTRKLCGLLRYIKYCLGIQEKALQCDLTRWTQLLEYYRHEEH